MPGDAEIIKTTVEEFQKMQMHMKNAKDENAVKIYEVQSPGSFLSFALFT